jgi:hypothetical protein
MNEEELKKGCGRYIEEEDRDCGNKYGYYKRERRNYIVKKSGYDLWLCPTCQARLEGFQKGKLEQKKEELEFLKERCIYCMIADERIKQLQKEIGGNEK